MNYNLIFEALYLFDIFQLNYSFSSRGEDGLCTFTSLWLGLLPHKDLDLEHKTFKLIECLMPNVQRKLGLENWKVQKKKKEKRKKLKSGHVSSPLAAEGWEILV